MKRVYCKNSSSVALSPWKPVEPLENFHYFLAKTKVPAVLKTTQFTYFKANDGSKTIFGSRGFWKLNATLSYMYYTEYCLITPYIWSNYWLNTEQPLQIQCSPPLLHARMIPNAPLSLTKPPKFHRFWTLISSNRMNSRRFLRLISAAFYTRYTVLESRGTNRSTRKFTSNTDPITHKLEKRGGISAIVGTTRWRLKLIILLKIR